MSEANNDNHLMGEVRAGRTGALATLFERHHARVFRFCLRMTGDRQSSEDLVQEVFMRILRYRKSFKSEFDFAPWMFRIARNACVDHLRYSDGYPDTGHDMDGKLAEQPTADDELAGHEQAHLVRRALLRLPVERREVLVLSRFEFKSYEEIAGVLGCSVGAVKVRAHRAMKQLRQLYTELSKEAAA